MPISVQNIRLNDVIGGLNVRKLGSNEMEEKKTTSGFFLHIFVFCKQQKFVFGNSFDFCKTLREFDDSLAKYCAL
jgi:hypothetical protein